MQQIHAIFLASLLILLQGSSVQGAWRYASPTAAPTSTQNYTTVRMELDPDAASVTGNCTAKFSDSLTAQISIWFVDGIASQTQSYPPLADASSFFKNTVFRGRRNDGNNRALLMGDEGEELQQQQQQNRDLACTINYSCSTCCPAFCSNYCGGACILCGKSRGLRGGDGRELEGGRWWAAVGDDDEKQTTVAQSVQFSAQRWLYRNDPTRCMGNPWKLVVQLSYF